MADLPSQLSTALAHRYQLERELGRGGMATVYLARDLRHRRPIALKVLHPELAYALGADRFLREIELAANLTHPHILPLHDSGEAAGLLYYIMPYVEGESLRDRLRRETQLPVDEAVRIAGEVADALTYAHGHGIVHRDIKPENVLLSGGHALVTDFGIARAVDQAGNQRLTETGMAVGTAAYMSPEQASGQRQIDGRSDVYSLGCVLYEMLAGEPPYTGPSAQAIIAKRFSDPVPSIRRLRAAVPEAVDHAVSKALAPTAADRFATAADMARTLAGSVTQGTTSARTAQGRTTASGRRRGWWAAGVAAALGIMAVSGALLWRHHRKADNPSSATRIAVLPFENLGPSADDYFAEGMSDAVRGKLSALPALQVIARQSSDGYEGSGKSVKEIGRELGVRYLLTATVRWDKREGASRVQVSPELVDVSTASTKWQQPFDAAMVDVFEVQSQIAGHVAEALQVALGAKEQGALAERPTKNLQAYDAYLKTGDVSESGPAGLRKRMALMEKAVALDSSFSEAWAHLALQGTRLYTMSVPSAELAEATRRAAERAVALDPDQGLGHIALASYLLHVRRDQSSALVEFKKAQELDPNSVEAMMGASTVAQTQGRWEETVALMRKAQRLDPRSYLIVSTVEPLIWLRRYGEALEASERVFGSSPSDLENLHLKAMIYLGQGDLAGAKAVIRAAHREVKPEALVAYFATYWDLYWVLDDAQQRLLLQLTPEAFDNNRSYWALCLAETHALRGDTARARAYADSARASLEAQLKESPNDDQLHSLHGLMLAYLGRSSEAVRAGKEGVRLLPISRDAYFGPYLEHLLIRIYILAGEPDQALDLLESLLRIPYFLSPGWLRIDPTFDPLRGNPRFERLVNSGR
ncbi:MAG TPA: protein kinase [Gemmatimonadales bacterium]